MFTKYIKGLRADYNMQKNKQTNLNLKECLFKSTNSVSLVIDILGIKTHNGLDKKCGR